jgi:predicted N-formylglutamate amidohydrolase
MTAPRTLRPQGTGRYVFFCDHASNAIPSELDGLGLHKSDLERHIAWDIGAAGVTEALSEIFDSPAILCGTSRLVIDANRQLTATDLIPAVSDGTAIPGNLDLSDASRGTRIQQWFRPYHDAVETIFLGREAREMPSIAISIHSMAACLDSTPGTPRPWQIALSSYLDRRLTDPVLAALQRAGDIVVGDNRPYALDPDVDYSIPFHALSRNLPHLQVEFRQDEIMEARTQAGWALRLAETLTSYAL